MIIIKLVGALGNQMFQYAYGRSVSMRANESLKLDKSGYFRKSHLDLQDDERRIPLIDKFNIKAEFATEEELGKYNPLWKKVWNKGMNKLKGYDDLNVFKESRLNVSPNSYIQGFWPSEKYFKDIENEIRSELTLKEKFGRGAQLISDEIECSKQEGFVTVSVHVRRGDYLKPHIAKIFGVLGKEYYERAFEALKIALPDKKLKAFIFSDDMPWVKEHLSLGDGTYFASNEMVMDYEDIMLMSQCAHHIIANSTFSWWGAWLNQSPKKIVIAPERWLADSRNTKDVLPEEWIKIKS